MEVKFKGADSAGDEIDTSHMYNPLCDSRSGLNCTVTDVTVVFPI